MKTALLLSGGGARGIVQAGMIQAFRDLGLQYDMLFGASVGALNGCMLHADKVDEMIELWMRVKSKDVYNFAPWKLFTPEACLYDTTPLRANIKKHCNFLEIRKNTKPFFVAITRIQGMFGALQQMNNDIWRAPDMEEFLMQSTAAPIAFPAVNGATDGGILNNYGIATAIKEGCDRLILLMPTVPEDRPIKSVLDMAEFLVSAPEYGYLSREMYMVEKLNTIDGFKKIEVVVVKPDKRVGLRLLDFDMKGFDRKLLIGYGRELAMRSLRRYRTLV